eukprot:tig00020544_g10496.t1
MLGAPMVELGGGVNLAVAFDISAVEVLQADTTIAVKLDTDYDAFVAMFANGSYGRLLDLLATAGRNLFQRSQIYGLSVTRGSVLIRFKLLRLAGSNQASSQALAQRAPCAGA